jgi:hypothetical protein
MNFSPDNSWLSAKVLSLMTKYKLYSFFVGKPEETMTRGPSDLFFSNSPRRELTYSKKYSFTSSILSFTKYKKILHLIPSTLDYQLQFPPLSCLKDQSPAR